jgi:hypothetical protein
MLLMQHWPIMTRDLLRGVLFALVHFCAFHPTITTHLNCVFPSLVDDMHIIGLALDMLHVFLQLQKEFGALGLSM